MYRDIVDKLQGNPYKYEEEEEEEKKEETAAETTEEHPVMPA